MTRTAYLSRWHRRAGLAVCLFVIVLATTGIALNHTQEMQLAQRSLQWPWLLKLYGMPANTPLYSYRVQQRWVSQWQQRVYADTQLLALPPIEHLVGAVSLPIGMAVVSTDSVWLLDAEARVIDRLERPGTAAISSVGVVQDRLLLRLADATQWQTNADYTGFESAIVIDVPWATATTLPDPLKQHIGKQAGGVSVERVLLDLHSGRLLSRVGPWLMDLSGVGLLILACSGIWMVTRRWRRHPGRHHPGRHHS